MPEHLIHLSGSCWKLWRCAVLRSAGFPVTMAFALTTPDCAATADRLIQAEGDTKKKQQLAQDTANAELDALRARGEWEDREKRRLLLYARDRIYKGKLPKKKGTPLSIKIAAEELLATRAEASRIRREFLQVFNDTIHKSARMLCDVAQNDRFREAIIWQNRHAFHTGVKKLSKERLATTSRNKRWREHENLVISYLQRYCMKNDSIGFFGPVGWARFDLDEEALTARPGSSLLAERTVYFEQWCIDSLVQRLNAEKSLQPWIAPCRLPHLYLDGRTLHLPAKSVTLSTNQAAVLDACFQACDGLHTAKEIASDLIRLPTLALTAESEVYELLNSMREAGLISWKLILPLQTYPEKMLQQQLEQIGEARWRESALALLSRLQSARQEVAHAGNNPEKLNQALENLEQTFTTLMKKPATRAAGETYAARTLVFEDSRRDIEVLLGREILQALTPPLSLLLTSARWFTYKTAELHRQLFREMYQDLVQETGDQVVNFTRFWHQIQPLLYGPGASSFTKVVVDDFQNRWAEILALPSDQRRVHYASKALRSQVEALFEAPNPGWEFARYHSPDLMIAAPSLQAIQEGNFELVLGEFHVGTNTIRASGLVQQHPNPEELFRAVECDLPDPRIVPLPPRDWPRISSRTRPAFVRPKDFYLLFAADEPGSVASAQSLSIGSLVIREENQKLVVCTRDACLKFDIVEVFAEALSLQIVNQFKLLPSQPYTPRINIDRLVVWRETWRFPVSDLSFINCKEKAERFVEVRRWAHIHGLPRFVFVRITTEIKPFFVDLHNPLFINMFTRIVRRTQMKHDGALVTVSEMLPDPYQAWLPDAAGHRYTSEFRLALLDWRTKNSQREK